MPEGEIPPAPWKLRGDAVVAVRRIRMHIARAYLPTNARPLSVSPGIALSLLYLARYTHSPVGPYHELIVVPAVLRAGWSPLAWISHIVVDSAASQAAGQSIWSLPKELAEFTWQLPRVECSLATTRLQLDLGAGHRAIPAPFIGRAASEHTERAQRFGVRGHARIEIRSGSLQIEHAPFVALGFERCRTFYVLHDLRVRIGTPRTLALPMRSS